MARAVTNVRPDPSAFVGRGGELQRSREELETTRLLTLTGPPGVGKTRLARELALACDHAAWFCDLSAVAGTEGIAAGVACALDLPFSEGRSAEDAVAQIGRALARRGPLTLILDDFDHLVAHSEATLGRWYEAAPETRFIVTSRQRLGMVHESVFELRPLDARTNAVELFVARARNVRRDFEPTEAELVTIRLIAERLDGLPLAIELAAARVGVLGVRQLWARLESSFSALERVETPERSTLRGALEWSWELSSERERHVLESVSACAGGFDARAAEALTELDESQVLDALEALANRSLLVVEDRGGEIRFRMLSTVHELAREKLAKSGRLRRVQGHHAEHYLALGELALKGIDGPDALALFERMRVERDNLVAVARRELENETLTREGVELALRALLALERLCIIREPLDGYVALLEGALLSATALGVDRRMIVEGLRMRGGLCLFLGRSSESERDNRTALALARQLGDVALEARLLAALALSGLRRAPVAPEEVPKRRIDARQGMEEALALYPHEDARRGILLNNLGVILEGLGDWEEAERRYDQAVACYRNVPCQSAGVALASRGALHYASGRLAEAQADLRQALDILTAFGDRRSGAYVHAELGALYAEQGLSGEARAELEACLARHAEAGLSWYEGTALATLGDLELFQGHAEDAREHYEAALGHARAGGDAALQVRALTGAACALTVQALFDPAREALGAAELLTEGPVSQCLVRATAAFLAWAEDSRLPSTDAQAALSRARDELSSIFAAAADQRSAVLRVRAQWLARRSKAEAERRASVAPGPTLRATADGKWFRPAAGEAVYLHRRPALALVLAHLVRLRVDSPGEGASLVDLFDQGWPGERIDPHSAAMRVHQAVATLRKLGLRRELLRKQDGYLLDPALRLERVEKPDAG